MLVAMLQHVFDPPPDSLAIPWRYLGELVAGALAGSVLAGDRGPRTRTDAAGRDPARAVTLRGT